MLVCHLKDMRYSFRTIPFLFLTLDHPNIRQPFLRYLLCCFLDLHVFSKRLGFIKTAPSHQRNPSSNNPIRKFRKSGVLTDFARRIYARGKKMVTLSALTMSSLPLPTQPVGADPHGTPPFAYSMTSLSNSLTLEREMNTQCGLRRDFGISDPSLSLNYKLALLVFHHGIFKHYWRDLGQVTRALSPYISVHALHEKVKAS